MKIAVMTRLLTKRDMDIDSRHILVASKSVHWTALKTDPLTLITFLLVLHSVSQKHPNPNNFFLQLSFLN